MQYFANGIGDYINPVAAVRPGYAGSFLAAGFIGLIIGTLVGNKMQANVSAWLAGVGSALIVFVLLFVHHALIISSPEPVGYAWSTRHFAELTYYLVMWMLGGVALEAFLRTGVGGFMIRLCSRSK